MVDTTLSDGGSGQFTSIIVSTKKNIIKYNNSI